MASAQTVRDYLALGITNGEYAVGAKLPTERELSNRFGVSRTVVREALVTLEAERQIARHVGRGTFVQKIASSDTPQPYASPAALLEARRLIEGELAALAVLNASEDQIEDLSAACEALPAEAGPAEFEIYDAKFHRAIASATRNPLLIEIYDLMVRAREGTEWRRLKSLRHAANPDRRKAVLLEHRAIVEAIRVRDAALARQATLHHLHNVWDNLLGR